MDSYYDDFLVHHGVKGMKWGVRRYQNYDGTWKNKARIGSAERVRQKQAYFRNKVDQSDNNALMRNTVNDWRRGRIASLELKARNREARDALRKTKPGSDDYNAKVAARNKTLGSRVLNNHILPKFGAQFGYTNIARGRYNRYLNAGYDQTQALLQGAATMPISMLAITGASAAGAATAVGLAGKYL